MISSLPFLFLFDKLDIASNAPDGPFRPAAAPAHSVRCHGPLDRRSQRQEETDLLGPAGAAAHSLACPAHPQGCRSERLRSSMILKSPFERRTLLIQGEKLGRIGKLYLTLKSENDRIANIP